MFIIELAAGLLSNSAGLLADSMDMLADAAVYGISLYAVGRGVTHQISAARLSGYFQIVLGATVLGETVRRLVFGSTPDSTTMVIIGCLALCANVACLVLLSKHRTGEIHMRASWIFSVNDVLANLGVAVSGWLVFVFSTNLPDIVAGAVISALVVRGGLTILRESSEVTANNSAHQSGEREA